jgi:hypothetical protein
MAVRLNFEWQSMQLTLTGPSWCSGPGDGEDGLVKAGPPALLLYRWPKLLEYLFRPLPLVTLPTLTPIAGGPPALLTLSLPSLANDRLSAATDVDVSGYPRPRDDGDARVGETPRATDKADGTPWVDGEDDKVDDLNGCTGFICGLRMGSGCCRGNWSPPELFRARAVVGSW